MKINGNFLVAVIAVSGVAIYAITRLAPTCEASYKFKFAPKEFGFECKIPPISKEFLQAMSQPSINELTSDESTNKTVPTVGCRKIRGSMTFRKRIDDINLADNLCKSKVQSVPQNFSQLPKTFIPQDDKSVTFNTGLKHNETEIWCNCHPMS